MAETKLSVSPLACRALLLLWLAVVTPCVRIVPRPTHGLDDPDMVRSASAASSQPHDDLLARTSRGALGNGASSLVEEAEEGQAEPKPLSKGKASLEKLPRDTQTRLLDVFGLEQVLHMLEMQHKEYKKDETTVGFSDLSTAFYGRSVRMLSAMANQAEGRLWQECSQLPDAVVSHLWRYKEEDVIACLGAPAGAGFSLVEAGACNGQPDPIPGSTDYSWLLASCSTYQAEKCKPDGVRWAGCCCPSGTRWDQGTMTCVACASTGLHPGSKCRLRCDLMPEVETTLTCKQGDLQLVGEAPEGHCRWKREREAVTTEAGQVIGMQRPVVWKWDVAQYNQSFHTQDEIMKVRTFWGVPFGRPVERFTRPQKVAPWSGARTLPDYYETGYTVPHCDPDGVDDCLVLSIDVPPSATRERLRPVMFWITADGFRSADVWSKGFYDGARFSIRQDSVLVIANRRSSLLGHWASRALADEDPDRSTGNYGMLDLRLALEWVRDNIAAFGGDPSRVTIGGHSSGGMSVNFHMYSPASRGLFSAAIIEGSSIDSGWNFQSLDEASEFYKAMGEALGCPAADAKEQLRCLRDLPRDKFSELLNDQLSELTARLKAKAVSGVPGALAGFLWSYAGLEGLTPRRVKPENADVKIKATPLWPLLPAGPVVDGSQIGLPEAPSALLARGDFTKVPVLMDFGQDEGTVFAAMMVGLYPWGSFPSLTHASVDKILTWVFRRSAPDLAKAVIQKYSADTGTPFSRLSAAIGDGIFKCSNRRFAMAATRAQGAAPVFLAETSYVPVNRPTGLKASLISTALQWLGANHMMATSWVFAHPMPPFTDSWTDEFESVSMMVNCHYGYFLHCHDPDITDSSSCYKERVAGAEVTLRSCLDRTVHLRQWPDQFARFDPDAPKKYLFASAPKVVDWEAGEEDRCDFWDRTPASELKFATNICRGCKK